MARWIGLFVTVIVVGWWVMDMRDPYNARLPIGSTDVSTIEAKLNKLKPGDKDLVLAYLARSGGQMLPPGSADPDEPFTARTVAQAIKLQKEYEGKGGERAQANAASSGSKALAEMRAALQARLIKRELVPRSQAAKGTGQMGALNEPDVLVLTFQVTNTSRRNIENFGGIVNVRTKQGKASISCAFNEWQPLQDGMSREVRCARPNADGATAMEREFAAMSPTEYVVEWTPQSLRFPTGAQLTSSGR